MKYLIGTMLRNGQIEFEEATSLTYDSVKYGVMQDPDVRFYMTLPLYTGKEDETKKEITLVLEQRARERA